MLETTLKKFGYPTTLIKEYSNWYLLCRPKQVTLGAMVLIAKSEAQSLAALTAEYFLELEIIVKEIENNLKPVLTYEKINYLMLMMLDPEVHFHILPRYPNDKVFNGISFADKGWPKIADLESATEIDPEMLHKLTTHLANFMR